MTRVISRSNIKRFTIIALIAVGLFVLVNFTIFCIFLSRTYPNTRLDNVAIGSVSYSKLTGKITASDVFPGRVSLKEGASVFTTSPKTLGVSENVKVVSGILEHKSWLPLANFWTAHKTSIALNVNTKTLEAELAKIARQGNVAPVGARISLSGGKFSLVDDDYGYSLNKTRAVSITLSDLKDNISSIKLPISSTLPAVTTASLSSQLKSLQAASNLSIRYSYGGKSTAVTPTDVSSWYVSSGDTYVIDASKIKAYINKIGTSYGIAVDNISSAVSQTELALTKLTSLSFVLTAVPNTPCTSNSLNQLILASISQQHLWVCNGVNEVYDSAIVTGDEQYADTLTPVGTYHIYAKETNKTLAGSDENGSWDDHVNYWMPFLYNQYGTYGLHDATWRNSSDFGNVNINTLNASNGCIELPLATAAWIYNWAIVGTTVKVEQ